jgi:hypothetical protein
MHAATCVANFEANTQHALKHKMANIFSIKSPTQIAFISVKN